MKTNILFCVFAALFLASCSLSDEELWSKAESAKASNNWDSTLIVCQKIIEEYPDGPYASWALFGIAESYRFKNQPREALNNYILFYDRYPDMQPSAVSLFMIGYIYHNNMLVSDSARFYYQKFLQKYPDHDLAPTVKTELETLMQYPPETLRYGAPG